MSPNTRPPISSRIRASFEGKRSNSDATRPTVVSHGLANNDADSLRAALDQALNTDYFQHAIANHLGKLIKPSIKSALDTIQPIVETVYAHEVLLKRTNESVENILQRLETVTEEPSSRRTSWIDPMRSHPVLPIQRHDRLDTAELEGPPTPRGIPYQSEELTQVKTNVTELSRWVDLSNSRIAEMADRIGVIHGSLTPTAQSLKSLQAWSNESKTNTSVMQAQLNQVKADIGHLIEVVPSDLAKCVKSIRTQVVGQDPPVIAAHSQRLEEIAAELGSLKGNLNGGPPPDVSADFETLKGKVEAGITSTNEHFDDLTWRLSNISTSLEGHTQALSDMKEHDASIDILKNTHRANETVTANGAKINALESKHSDSHTELIKAVEALALGGVGGAAAGAVKAETGSDSDSTAALYALAADLASLKENIQGGLTSNSDGVHGLRTKIDDVLTTLEAHREFQSTSLLGAVEKSNEIHASHTAALEAIQAQETAGAESAEILALDSKIDRVISTLDSLSTELYALKIGQPEAVAALESGSNAEIHSHLTSIMDTLGSHTSALDQIKSTGTSREIEAPSGSPAGDLGEVHSHLNNIILTLNQHSNDFKDLKDRNATAVPTSAQAGESEDLTSNITSIASILEVHTGLLKEIKEADVSEEILTLLHDCKDLHAGHTATFMEFKDADMSDEILTALHTSNDSHERHHRALADLNAAVKAVAISSGGASRDIVAETSVMGSVEPKIDAITLTLDGQTAILAEIRDRTTASNESHGAHMAMLEGIKDATTVSNDAHAGHSTVLTDIKTVVDGLHESHITQATTLDGIKDATTMSNESHTAHTASLTQLQETSNAANDLHASHVKALEELRALPISTPVPESGSPNITALETKIAAIVATLDAQSSILSEIKAATSDAEVLAAVKQSQDLLASHTSSLESIKEASSHSDILEHISVLKDQLQSTHTEHGALIKDMDEETKSSHANLTTTLSALAAGGGAGAIASELTKDSPTPTELLEKLSTIQTLTTSSSSTLTHLAAQLDINTTTLTTSISSLSDELKAEIDASSTEIATAVQGLVKEVKSIEVQDLSDAVGECAREMRGLSGGVEELQGGGVHLNERGTGQLREHFVGLGGGAPVAGKEVVEGEGVVQQTEGHVVEGGNELPVEHVPSPTVEALDKPIERDPVQSPIDEPAVEEPPVEEPPVEERPVEESLIEESSVKEVPTEGTPVPEMSTEEAAHEDTSADGVPVVEHAVKEPMTDQSPVKATAAADETIAEEAASEEKSPAEPVSENTVPEEKDIEEPVQEHPTEEPNNAVDEPPQNEAEGIEPEPELGAAEDPVSLEEPKAESAMLHQPEPTASPDVEEPEDLKEDFPEKDAAPESTVDTKSHVEEPASEIVREGEEGRRSEIHEELEQPAEHEAVFESSAEHKAEPQMEDEHEARPEQKVEVPASVEAEAEAVDEPSAEHKVEPQMEDEHEPHPEQEAEVPGFVKDLPEAVDEPSLQPSKEPEPEPSEHKEEEPQVEYSHEHPLSEEPIHESTAHPESEALSEPADNPPTEEDTIPPPAPTPPHPGAEDPFAEEAGEEQPDLESASASASASRSTLVSPMEGTFPQSPTGAGKRGKKGKTGGGGGKKGKKGSKGRREEFVLEGEDPE